MLSSECALARQGQARLEVWARRAGWRWATEHRSHPHRRSPRLCCAPWWPMVGRRRDVSQMRWLQRVVFAGKATRGRSRRPRQNARSHGRLEPYHFGTHSSTILRTDAECEWNHSWRARQTNFFLRICLIEVKPMNSPLRTAFTPAACKY